MRRGRPILLIIIVIFTLNGCQKTVSEPSASFQIEIINDCSTAVFGVHYEYFLGDRACGSGYIEKLDNTAYQTGDILAMDFTSEDFAADVDLSAFYVYLFIIDDNQREWPVDVNIAIDAEFGQTYTYHIQNGPDGYVLILD
ncbi:hypothetical protein SDC9_114411 [bioreactor metagenome]|uniref:Uncharacterized protein n=1 Tax=bioreactor metagenome TaxID=1076179 RepID=A0A645BQU4_9ZZZZ|nr:hypothetical protein [Erysipelotrichaceae bacterium]